MRNIGKIIWSDLRGLSRSALAILLVIAICIVPALYAWVNIYACWDPYGNMSNIPVAVYTEDQPYTLETGETVSMTEDLIPELQDEYDIGWTPVSTREEAVDGVQSGDYYAAVVIEADFTKSLFTKTLRDGDSVYFTYYENEKKNAIASKMTESAGTALRRVINRRYINTLTRTIFGELNDWRGELDQADDHAASTTDSLRLLKTNLESYQAALSAFIAGNAAMSDTAASIQGDVDYTVAGLNDVIESMNRQTQAIDSMAEKVTNSQEDVNTTLDDVQDQLDRLSDKMDRISSSDVPSELSDALSATKTLLANVHDQALTLSSLIEDLRAMDDDADTVAAAAVSSMTYLLDETSTLLDNAEALVTLSTAKSTMMQALLAAGYPAAQVEVMLSDAYFASTVQTLASMGLLSESQASSILAAAQTVAANGVTVESIRTRAAQVQTVYASLKTNIRQVASTAGKLAQDSGFDDGQDTVLRLEQSLDDKLADVVSQLDSLQKLGTAQSPSVDEAAAMLLNARKMIADTRADLSALTTVFRKIGDADPQLDTDEMVKLVELTQTNVDELQAVVDSAQTLLDTTGTVDDSLTKLTALAADTQTMVNDQLYPCMNNVLADMSAIMDEASSLLVHAQSTLAGSDAIFSGIQLSMTGANNSLADVKTLLDALADHIAPLIDDIDHATDLDVIDDLKTLLSLDPVEVGSFLAQPTTMDETDLYPVDSYGTGLAAFYSSLAIWIGCVFLTIIFKLEADPRKLTRPKPYQTYFGRYFLFFLTSLIQAAVTLWGDIHILHIQCAEPGLFWLAGLATSVTFSLFVYTLSLVFGNLGRALVVVLLVVQIAGSGGTYPIEILPTSFGAVYRFFPFYYSIGAMREAICGVYANDFTKYLLEMLIFVAVSLALGLVVRKPLHKINNYIEDQLDRTRLM